MEATKASKQQASFYQKTKKFISRSYASKEEFAREYMKLNYEKAKAEELFLLVFTELEKAVSQGNIDQLKRLSTLVDYTSEIKDKVALKDYYDNPNNPIRDTNLVILACKQNKQEILTYLFDSTNKILHNLSVDIGRSAILPGNTDETCHNAFYYAIRSGNIELLDTLINKWPDNYFNFHSNELDEILLRVYKELKLKNVPLSYDIEIFVVDKLINLRFFSDTSEPDNSCRYDLNTIKERIDLVLENINLLKTEYSNTEKVDEKFLFITKFIAQNIHTLKQQLKSTYDRLPWEEIEFCLVSFVSAYTKQQEINLFYYAILSKKKILNQLECFGKKLEEEKINIEAMDSTKISDLPKLTRHTVIANIINNCPQFEELYNDYQQIRDMYTLEKINNYVKLALSVYSSEMEGQIIIGRVLQVISNHLRNTLESPKLSDTISELLLLSLPEYAREVVIDLHDSEACVYSLSQRLELEKDADTDFFVEIQNDIEEINDVISDILCDNKMKMIRILLKRIVSSQNFDEIKEVMAELNNIKLDKMGLGGFKMNDHERLEISIQDLRDIILYKTDYEKELFNKINSIINFARTKLHVLETDYIQGIGSLRLLRIVFNDNKINNNVAEGLKFFVSKILENIAPEIKTQSLKEIAELSMKIFNSVTSRLEDDYHIMGDEIKKSFLEIFYIVEMRIDDVHWIKGLREKLIEDSYSISMYEQRKTYTATEQECNIQLRLKLAELKSVLNSNALNNRLINTCSSYKEDDKLQVVISTLVLDVMSILYNSENYLEDNLLFLDDDTPVLTGKCLYNYLAHDNALVDILLLDPSISTILNARKLSTENIIGTTKKIGNVLRDDPSKSKDKLTESLAIINIQKRMFDALEAGSLEDLKDCLKQGADLNARDFNLWTALHFAAKGPSLEVIKFILDHNLSVNVKNSDSQSPLHIAAAYDRRDIVRFFVKNTDLYIDNKDSNGKTPLHIAAQDGNTDIVDILLKNNANPNIKDVAGFSPLHSAVKNNHIDVVQILLKREVDSNELLGGFTSLHLAAEYGHLEMINFLLKNGVNINTKSDKGAIALHPAALNGHVEVVNALILKGTDVNVRLEDGNTPLHYAVENGHEEVANVLLKYGANTNVSDKAGKNTPLHLAVKDKYVEIVKLLLKYKARVSAVNAKGMTPLHFAVQSGHLEIVTILLEHNANINVKDNNKVTPLHYAAEKGYKEIADLLIKNKADVNAKDNNGFTPLYLAVLHDHTDVTELLIKCKAEVNTRDSKSCTPLHLAVINDNRDIIDFLIKNKARVNVRNSRSVTPLHTAAAIGNKDVVDLLVKNKADLNVKSNLGITPLHAAVIYGHEDVILLLTESGAQTNCIAKFGVTTLQSAVKGGYKNVVNLLIQNKADVNSTGRTDLTPLHMAVESRNKELVEILIRNGANVNVMTNYKMTPLSFAVKQNWKEIVEVLIANGANVNALNGEALSFATFFGYKDIIEILLENKADINLQFMDNKTPLHIAAMKRTTDLVELLLAKGAEVNAIDKKGATPLHYAARCGNVEIIELLLSNGANVNANCSEGTPLHYAVYEYDSVDVVRILLNNGADVSIKDHQDRTPLQVAVTHNQLECVKLMTLQSQKIDINAKDSDSWTVLHNAAQEGNLTMVKYLIEEGCDINARNADGSMPIHIAVEEGFRDIVEFMLNNGSTVHDRGTNNQTLLHYAAMTSQIGLAKYLISKGADINAQDDNGLTPMHTAAQFDYERFIEILLENGAVYNITDKHHRKVSSMASKKRLISRLIATEKLFDAAKHNIYLEVERNIKLGAFLNAKHAASKGYDGTPLHYAAWKGYEKIVSILVQNKANLNITGNKGFTPLHYAAKFSHIKIVMFLLCNGAIHNAVSEGGKTPLDFAVDRNIIKLLNLVSECFHNVLNDNPKVIIDINKIRDLNTVSAIMNARNRENESLVVVAMKNKFSKVQQLKEVAQPDVIREIDTALLFLYQEDYISSLKIFKNVYERRRRLLGPDNPATLDIQVFIAKILYKQGAFQEAADMLNEIFRKQKEMFGFDNENTLSTRSMYALILHRQGKDYEAFSIFEEVYEKQKELLGPDHTDTLDTQFHMAIVLDKQGKYEEALKLNKEVYKKRKETLGANHQTTICTQNNIAMILGNQGKYEEALKMYKMVYEKKKMVSGVNHSDTIRTLFNIAGVLLNQKKYDESLKAHQEILNLQMNLFGSNHPDTLNTQYNLANVLFAQNKWISAFKVYDECLDKRIAVFGLSHSSVLDIIHKMELINFRCKLEGSNASEIVKHVQTDINNAASKGNIQTLRGLLTNGADANDKDTEGRTPLHYAVSNGHLDVVNILLESGADVTQVTKKGNTALHTATSKNYKEIIEVLLRRVSREKMVDFVNAKTSGSGVTSLHVAAKNGSLDIVKCLLSYGAGYNVTNKDGKTPCDLSNNQDVKNLLQLIDRMFKDVKCGTAEAIDNLNVLTPDELVAVINARDEHGSTLVQAAIFSNKRHIAAKLLKMVQLEM
ncbi:uncharacterized protein LOC105664036 [Megachile rotundata]|uniref:uncharacterized protein LOC105664036 n=1 Tax=Megachile rotundata TaxID=143995 RepID=UPI0006151464|nr:PREDICTED: uncharacterized protein LOC105664036 [Megachile rotundata]